MAFVSHTPKIPHHKWRRRERHATDSTTHIFHPHIHNMRPLLRRVTTAHSPPFFNHSAASCCGYLRLSCSSVILLVGSAHPFSSTPTIFSASTCASTTTENWAQAAKTDLGKKLAPPPPAFGFAASKPGAASTPPKVRKSLLCEEGEVEGSDHLSMFSSRFRYVKISVRDVLVEQQGAFLQQCDSFANAVYLSAKDALMDLLEEEEMKAAEKRLLREQQHQSTSSSSSSSSPATGDGADIFVQMPKSAQQQQQQQVVSPAEVKITAPNLIRALGVPEDIIAALRPYTEQSGSVSFSRLPTSVVRALVGHDGFTATPALDDAAHPGIVAAVSRVIAPVGVYKLDAKREAIKVRPGVAQLAARIEACIAEIWATNPSNLTTAANPAESAKIVNKKVALSAVHGYLTGSEKTFAADVGGLARVVAVFPSRFQLTKDSTYVARLNVPVGNAAVEASVKAKLRAIEMDEEERKRKPFPGSSGARAQTASPANDYFSSAVEAFRAAEVSRIARNATGVSLLEKGSSIFAEDELLDDEDSANRSNR